MPSSKKIDFVTQHAPFVGNWPADQTNRQAFPLQDVRLGGFLGKHVEANTNSILAGLTSPIAERFRCLALGQEPPSSTMRLASDTDLFKWLEGACYALVYTNDANTRAKLSEAIQRAAEWILAAQQPDGYINTQVPPYSRFDTKINHDLYIAGHFFEAATAHAHATDSDILLNAACRWADYLCREHDAGNPYFATVGEKEHPEIELGLLRLYKATQCTRYLELAQVIARASQVNTPVAALWCGNTKRHAVRVGYLLAARAELALITGDSIWLDSLVPLWHELVDTRLYVTGGIGYNEIIPETPYDLPESLDANPHRDIAETCASVAMMMFTWRLQAATSLPDAYDVIERILYNHYMGALSLDHMGNFYYNPLRVIGDQSGLTDHGSSRTSRKRLPEIHSTACCMPNSWRFWAQLPEYMFSHDQDTVYINLYSSAKLDLQIDGQPIFLQLKTNYPQDGHIALRVQSQQAVEFSLAFRLPDWAECLELSVNNQSPQTHRGENYVRLQRVWQDGDTIHLILPIETREIDANPNNPHSRGKVALAHGPIIYCLEDTDNTVDIAQVVLPAMSPIDCSRSVHTVWNQELSVPMLETEGRLANSEIIPLRFIPFYTRANRSTDSRWTVFVPSESTL